MKTIIKLTLVLCLYGSVAFAGDMGGGGYQCPPEGCTPPPCQVNCLTSPVHASGNSEIDVVAVYTPTEVAIDAIRETLGLLF